MKKFLLALSAVICAAAPLGAQNAAFDQLAGGDSTAPQQAPVPAPAPVPGGTLTIYAYPPYRPINWATPRSALKGVAATVFDQAVAEGPRVNFVSDFGESGSMPRNYRSSIGHTITHVNCTLPDGKPYDAWTSFSGQDFHQVDKGNLLDKELGMGVLFQDYIDGHIISGEQNRLLLIYYQNVDGARPRYWEQKIDGQGCARVRDMVVFFKSFHFPKGSTLEQLEARPTSRTLYFTSSIDPYRSYMARKLDPEASVGGGCAPYGLGLLKAAHKYDYTLDDVLTLRLQVSERLIGGIPDGRGGVRRVPVLSLLGKLGDSWTWPGYKNREFRNYDPSLIWKFIGGVDACLTGGAGCTPEASAWLSANRGRVSAGPAQSPNSSLPPHLQGIIVD